MIIKNTMLKYISLLSFFILLSCNNSEVIHVSEKNTIQEYKPKKPIKFPHAIHTDVNKIDCKYCHTPSTSSENGEVKTENNCTDCHKQVSGR